MARRGWATARREWLGKAVNGETITKTANLLYGNEKYLVLCANYPDEEHRYGVSVEQVVKVEDSSLCLTPGRWRPANNLSDAVSVAAEMLAEEL